MLDLSIINEGSLLNPNTLRVYKSDLDYFDKWIKSYKEYDVSKTHDLIQEFTQYQRNIHVNEGTIKRRVSVIQRYHPTFQNHNEKIDKYSSLIPKRFLLDFETYLSSTSLESASIKRYIRDIKTVLNSANTPPIPISHTNTVQNWLIKFLDDESGKIYSHLFKLRKDHLNDLNITQVLPKTHNHIDVLPYFTFIFKNLLMFFFIVSTFFLVFGIFSVSFVPKNNLANITSVLPKKSVFGLPLRLVSTNENSQPAKVLEVIILDVNSQKLSSCTVTLENILDSLDLVFYFNTKNCSQTFQKNFLKSNYLTFRINNDFPSYPPQKIADLQNPSYFAYQNSQDILYSLDALKPTLYTPEPIVTSFITLVASPSATLTITPTITPQAITATPTP